MALWLTEGFSIVVKSFKELGFQQTQDVDVNKIAASKINTIITITKDIDFINYQDETGEPSKILYINVGNISNKNFKIIILNKFAEVLQLFLKTTKSFIEISL